jgi:hypothetical protein
MTGRLMRRSLHTSYMGRARGVKNSVLKRALFVPFATIICVRRALYLYTCSPVRCEFLFTLESECGTNRDHVLSHPYS